MKRVIIILSAIALVLGTVLLIPQKHEYSTYIHGALGTESEIRIYAKNDSALKECREYIYKMDSLLSLSNSESELSKLNKEKNFRVSPETKDILELALSYTDASTFNPFCGTLISLWDKAKETQTLPTEIILSDIYPPSLKFEANTAYIENPNQEINLGAIAKGYITDQLVKILDKHKVDSALISLGGNVYAKGKNKTGKPWKIGIANPDNSGEYIGIISATDISVITSGDYERYFEIDGKRYHHIIDPKTGYPADSGLRSVTVITPDATLGDMLSTKCFIAGYEESKNILKEYNAYGIFVTDDYKVYYSKELEDKLEFKDENYQYHKF